jgi:HAMP domain-containing protein
MELGDTAQAIRTILEYLERHPEALIMGKEE